MSLSMCSRVTMQSTYASYDSRSSFPRREGVSDSNIPPAIVLMASAVPRNSPVPHTHHSSASCTIPRLLPKVLPMGSRTTRATTRVTTRVWRSTSGHWKPVSTAPRTDPMRRPQVAQTRQNPETEYWGGCWPKGARSARIASVTVHWRGATCPVKRSTSHPTCLSMVRTLRRSIGED